MRQPTDSEREIIVSELFGKELACWASSAKFSSYFDHYCSIVCPASSQHGDAVIELDTILLQAHSDVLRCAQIIFQQPKITFDQFAETIAMQSGLQDVSPKEKEHLARVTVEVCFAINCMRRDYCSPYLQRRGIHRTKWEGDICLVFFVEAAFKTIASESETGNRNTTHWQKPAWSAAGSLKSIKAWKLVKRYGIKIRGTNDLLEHLDLDLKTMTLKVFHQVSFLRGHLSKTKDASLNLSFEESVKRGSLPPALILETLLTFHDILFPIASIRDKKSRVLLNTMIAKHSFDAEAKWIEFVRPIPEDMSFDYWGDRLAALYKVVQKPPPTNALVAWFERHTSERNALTVAIVGLFLSVLFGLLSFIVGLLQLILAWVAYRNPPEGRRD
ncbi:hypothetical protein QBC36DRAFT_205161 [Triangularia setosa]|uniref:Uncharacterized protein n=1 Tax=Triangularia setosa TaxID=2587417 RepID=A0AAN6WE48_9PEZI|nr:hypothetical protein QBC36DRAFT_205161 [Podospora setosa]